LTALPAFDPAAHQIGEDRVYGGIHTREYQAVGRVLGAKVGQFVYENLGRSRQ
jgi:hypothetical protein